MTKFLFWNLNRKDLAQLVVAAADQHTVDVLILGECALEEGKILVALNNRSERTFHLTESFSNCAKVFTRFSRSFLRVREESDWVSIRQLRLPNSIPLSIAIVHLPSKRFQNEASQAQACAILARQIRDYEAEEGHSNTLVVGDLNMNPFESGIVSAAGLNATMSRVIAAAEYRSVYKNSYPFFYNPMWNLFGDDDSAPGTFFYNRNEHVAYFWHLFDQMLVRPRLLDRLPRRGVQMLTEINGISLLRKDGRPDNKFASDHLPIVFGLDLDQEATS